MGRLVLRILAGLVILLVAAVAIVFVLGGRAISATPTLPPETFTAGPADSAAIATGERLAILYQCTACHGEALDGTNMIEGMPFMNLAAPNLTAGGVGGTLTDTQWERAVRHGIGSDGTALLIMPSDGFAGLSDADLSAIIAYARSLPETRTTLITTSVGPIGRAAALFDGKRLMAAGMIDHTASHAAIVAADSSAEQGAYLARACTACHGPDFGGMTLAFAEDILAPDLTSRNPAGMAGWTAEEFVRAMRAGVRPDGRELSDVMPWRAFGRYSSGELSALWQYLSALPAATSAPSAR